MTSVKNVTGHLICLDETRLVFLGESPSAPGVCFIAFRNAEGNDTKLILSPEAMNALVKLHTAPEWGEPVEFPHKMVWQVVCDSKDMTE